MRAIAHMTTHRRDPLTRDAALTAAQIDHRVPQPADAAPRVDALPTMIRARKPDLLGASISKAEKGLPPSFAGRLQGGFRAGGTALSAATEEPWSMGQADRRINRLKTPKRQMDARAKLDALKAMTIAA